MERIPRARPQTDLRADALTRDDRPAQHLQSRRDGAGRVQLHLGRPAVAVEPASTREGAFMSSAHRFDPTLLREYDIRGIVGSTLTTADAQAVGRAFGTVVRRGGGSRVCVGYDGRLSSPELEESLVAGLVAAGIQVERIGLGPTPMLYFAVRHREADGGLMITGSHNPPEYNGIKMMLGKAPFFG